MNWKNTIRTVFAVAVLSIPLAMATQPARAESYKDVVVNARQGFFDLVFLNAGVLFSMGKGDVAYNAKDAQVAADNLVKLTSLNTVSIWSPGTSKEEMPGKTRALKKIWDTWPALGDKYAALQKAAADMAKTAGTGLDGVKANLAALGGACKGCHDNYRAKDF